MMAFPDPLDNLLLPSLSPNDNFSPASSSISSNASTVWSPSHSHYSSLSSMLTANTSENTTAESSDRETILFPTYAMRCPQTHEWIIHIRGWALSHNISAVKQKVATGLTKNLIAEGSPNHADHLFEQRFKYFLAKNKRNKHFVIHASGATSLEHRPLDPRDNIPDVYSSRRSSSGSDDSGFQSATEDYYKVTSTEDFAFDEFSPVYDPILESRPGNPLSTILDGGNKFYVTDSPSTATLSSYEEYHDDLFDESQLIEECNQLTIQSECTSTTEDSSESLHSASTPHSIVLKSESNGFYNGQIRVSDSQIQEWMSGQASTNRLVQLQSKASGFAPGLTHVSLVEEHGISIISDIDDTIKDTQILSGARTVLTNTFCKEAQAVEGMAKAYKDWYDSGASFHYVSNSPFQLLPMLDQFIKDKQFPPGSMHLRVDGSILARLVEVPGRAKRDAIKQIMNDFPKRQFVLIGDSGEIDLEIYARIASEFPGRVLKIFIRDVSKKPSASVRRRNTLSSLFASPKRSKSVTTSQPPPPPPPLSENGRAQTLADLATSSSGIHSRVAKAREQCPVDIELFQNAETLQRDPVIWHALCQ